MFKLVQPLFVSFQRMEVFLVGIGHRFGFRYLAGDVGGFAQLVYEFHVFQYLPGVVVHVFF